MQRKEQYLNATSVKLENKRVTVFTRGENLLVKIDVFDKSLPKLSHHEVTKNKVISSVTGLKKDTAIALIDCLVDELKRQND